MIGMMSMVLVISNRQPDRKGNDAHLCRKLTHLWLASPFSSLRHQMAILPKLLLRHDPIMFRCPHRIFAIDRRQEGDEVVLVPHHILSGCAAGDDGIGGLDSVSSTHHTTFTGCCSSIKP